MAQKTCSVYNDNLRPTMYNCKLFTYHVSPEWRELPVFVAPCDFTSQNWVFCYWKKPRFNSPRGSLASKEQFPRTNSNPERWGGGLDKHWLCASYGLCLIFSITTIRMVSTILNRAFSQMFLHILNIKWCVEKIEKPTKPHLVLYIYPII